MRMMPVCLAGVDIGVIDLVLVVAADVPGAERRARRAAAADAPAPLGRVR